MVRTVLPYSDDAETMTLIAGPEAMMWGIYRSYGGQAFSCKSFAIGRVFCFFLFLFSFFFCHGVQAIGARSPLQKQGATCACPEKSGGSESSSTFTKMSTSYITGSYFFPDISIGDFEFSHLWNSPFHPCNPDLGLINSNVCPLAMGSKSTFKGCYEDILALPWAC